MRNKLVLIIVNALLVIAFIASLLISKSIKNTLRTQQAATVWAGQSGEHFAQLSAFLPSEAKFDEDSVRSLRQSIEKALTDASLEPAKGRHLYTDAWSAVGSVSVSSDRGSASAQVFGVGGSFFLFHPLYLRDGSYLSPNDLMKDRVVLDEELAWRLFGSAHLAGLDVTIAGKPFLIAGVVSREKDFASSKAYSAGAGMFMSYEALCELKGSNVDIQCYEIVLPEPIAGFAAKTFTDHFPVKDADIIENSARYSFSNLIGIIGSYGTRSMRADGKVYPYWENAARYAEDWLALLLLLSFIFAVFPVVCCVVYGTRGIRFLIRGGRGAVATKISERDEREAEKYRQAYMDEYIEKLVVQNVEEIIREYREEQEMEG